MEFGRQCLLKIERISGILDERIIDDRMFDLNSYRVKHHDLFTYLPAKEIHPHDQLMQRTVLRLLPRWVTPNQITLLRIILTPIVFAFVVFGDYTTGVILFLLTAFTDAIDGSLARTRNKITKFGMLFDPLADKLLIGLMVLVLVFQHFDIWLGVALLGIEIAIITSALVAKVMFKTVHAANLWGKIKMILQVLAVFLTLLALLLEFPLLLTAAAWIFGLAIGFAILSLFAHGV